MSLQDNFDPYAILQVRESAEQEVIRGAYRALARKYHPDNDGSHTATKRMVGLNQAYELLRDPDSRAAFARSRRTNVAGVSVATSNIPPPYRSAGGSVLQFGRYTGWGLRDVARVDPDYLLWLSRHSSGIRYRQEIYAIMSAQGISPN